jgi:hypothetical protein
MQKSWPSAWARPSTEAEGNFKWKSTDICCEIMEAESQHLLSIYNLHPLLWIASGKLCLPWPVRRMKMHSCWLRALLILHSCYSWFGSNISSKYASRIFNILQLVKNSRTYSSDKLDLFRVRAYIKQSWYIQGRWKLTLEMRQTGQFGEWEPHTWDDNSLHWSRSQTSKRRIFKTPEIEARS